MQVLSSNEIEEVSGAWDITTSAGLTIGLMALAPASVFVVTTGMVALGFYTVYSMY